MFTFLINKISQWLWKIYNTLNTINYTNLKLINETLIIVVKIITFKNYFILSIFIVILCSNNNCNWLQIRCRPCHFKTNHYLSLLFNGKHKAACVSLWVFNYIMFEVLIRVNYYHYLHVLEIRSLKVNQKKCKYYCDIIIIKINYKILLLTEISMIL